MYFSRRILFILSFFLLFLLRNSIAQTFWTQNAGGPTIDQANDVAVDGFGNTYVTGYFTSVASFGSITLSSNGVDDVFLAKLGVNGMFAWAVKAGGINSERALSIKTDGAGNSYITGYFYGTATFGSIVITSSGAQDIFIAKYNNAGLCLWAKRAGGTGADIGNGITVDNLGNVIVVGEFDGSATFGSTVLNSMNGSTDVFTTKLDVNGSFVWAKKGAASLTDRGLDVDCDATGNIYITGQFSDTITFDIPHINTMLNAVFVLKYNPSGQEQWFRKIGGGAMNIGNSIACDNLSGVYLVGDFQGTITFYGPVVTTLSATYINGIFLAKYDMAGGLTWSVSESSDSPLTGKSVATNGTNCFIAGNFKCTFDSYSIHYGAGIFNSSGYWDIFEGKYSSNGSWIMGRQLGGKKDQLCSGIAIDAAGNPHLSGSYDFSLITPTSSAFYGYPSFNGYNMFFMNNIVPQGAYCNDPFYGSYANAYNAGNSDIFVGNPIDPNRSPYDYYYRTGSGCSTPLVETCINIYSGLDFLCGNDTLSICLPGQLYANTNTSSVGPNNSSGPDFTFLWSTNQVSQNINVVNSGYYSVVMTTADACYTSEDTIYVAVHPAPVIPTISDNVVINSNAVITQQIVLCADSVILTGGNYGNNTVTWQGPAFYPQLIPNPVVVVDSSGLYVFTVTDIFGCTSSNTVMVTLDHPLLPIDPAIICFEDLDLNDTITTCENDMLTFFPYDSAVNPTANFVCIDDLTIVQWTVSPNTATITPTSDCTTNFAQTYGMFHQTGWYTITATIIRTSACGNDTTVVSHDYYIIVLPAPPTNSLVLTISPPIVVCPGDSTLFVVSGGTVYTWSTGSQNDSIYVSIPGNYYVNGFDTITNSYGCSSVSSASVQTNLSFTPQPIIVMLPSSGLICPGDSVQFVVSGNGTFAWQGPNGPIANTGNTIWVNSPGVYYVIETTPDSCQLLSNSVVVQQYNTPSIQAVPSSVLCPGDTVVISLTASSNSSVTWQAPLTGTALTQAITIPGVYSCTVLACNIITTVSITIVSTSITAVITPLTSTIACVGDSVLLSGNTGVSSYNWLPGNNSNQSIQAYTDGLYYLTTMDSAGCTATDSFQVNFIPNLLLAPLAFDTTICEGTLFTLTAYGAPVINWYNTPGGTVLETGPVFQVNGLQTNTSYYVLTNDGICKSQPTEINVFVEDCSAVIPNVFTPNGDGLNDFFSIFQPYGKGLHVWIYNRWGELINEWDGLTGYWDGTYMENGKPVSDGVYYYIAEVLDISNLLQTESGFVQLIRGKQ